MENSSNENMSYEHDIKYFTNIKNIFNAKMKHSPQLSFMEEVTYLTLNELIDMVLYLSERVKVLEQEKEHFYE